MSVDYTVIVLGGGLAGLTSALHLSKIGINVMLIEKMAYPHHKVCGEYISNEVLPYFKWLNVDIDSLKPTSINKFQINNSSGKTASCSLDQGGFGISRFTLDHYLFKQVESNGIRVLQDTVDEVVFEDDYFKINTQSGERFTARYVFGAFGKRSNLDVKLKRNFIEQKAPFLAVKAHYSGPFDTNLVGLYTFEGGYCGVSKVENNLINICYITDYTHFKKHKNISSFQEQVLKKNPKLNKILSESKMVFDEPLAISQISFGEKQKIENHVIMVGDTAGLIHPLCGNGMAMAINSAKIACDAIADVVSGKISSRMELEAAYMRNWKNKFSFRLRAGSFIASILRNPTAARILLASLAQSPFLLKQIIKITHGKPIII